MNVRKLTSLILAFVMCLSLACVSAYAKTGNETMVAIYTESGEGENLKRLVTVTGDSFDPDTHFPFLAITFPGKQSAITQPVDTDNEGHFEVTVTVDEGIKNHLDTATASVSDSNGDPVQSCPITVTGECTVTFDVDGGTPAIEKQTVNAGLKAVKPADPTKEGYTFGGWFKEKEFTNEWNFDTDTVTGDITLYAKWEIIQYTVTFVTNGGSAVADQTVDYGAKVTEPANFTKANATFQGWYKESTFATKWDFKTDTVKADTTLYAKWLDANNAGASITRKGSTTYYETLQEAVTAAATNDEIVVLKPNQRATVNKPVSFKTSGAGADSATITPTSAYSVNKKDNGDKTFSYTFTRKSSDTTPATPTTPKTPTYVSGGGSTGIAGVNNNAAGGSTSTPTTPTPSTAPTGDTNANGGVGGFSDVKSGDYFAAPVLWALNNNVTNGVDVGKFGPEAPCTRAQMVTFLWRAAGSPDAEVTGAFKDVASDAYYAKAVSWAVLNGITNGKGASDVFAPDDLMTRAEAVTFLSRALKGSSTGNPNFNDVPADAWFSGAVAWAVENGITNGMGDNQFQPNTAVNRAMSVTFLYRAYGNK